MNYDLDTLVALKEEFQSNEFQWVKTKDRSKLGKRVEVRDVVPIQGDRFIAVLSDGTKIDTDQISSSLMMITDDQPAMSMAEVLSLNYVPSLTEDSPAKNELSSLVKQLPAAQPTTLQEAVLGQPPIQIIQTSPKFQVDTADLFGMFTLEDTDLSLTVSTKIPEKNLLKMMYNNSKDKDEFLTKLANYINNTVTVDSIKQTLEKMLGGTKKKKVTDEQ